MSQRKTTKPLSNSSLPANSQDLFRSLVELNPDMIVVADSTGQARYANPSIASTLGYTVADFLQCDTWSLVHPDDVATVKAGCAAVFASPKLPVTWQYRVRHQDGSYHWLDVVARSIPSTYDADEMLMTCRDITTQKITDRAQERAREQGAGELLAKVTELEAVIESITNAVVLTDTQSKILRMNGAGRKMLGLLDDAQFEHYSNLTVAERVQWLDMRDIQGNPLEYTEIPHTRVVHGETLAGPNVFEVRIRDHAGQERVWSFCGAPIFAENGQIIGGVSEFRDVTDQHQLEASLLAQTQELQTIIETISDGVYVYDKNGRVTRMNGAGRALLGNQNTDVHIDGTPDERAVRWDFRDSSGAMLPQEQLPLYRVLHGERLFGAHAMDLWLQPADGQQRLISYSGAPMHETDGQISGAVIVGRDVTLRHQLEQKLQESLEALLQMAQSAVSGGKDVHTSAKDLAMVTCKVLGCRRVGIITIAADTGFMRPLTVAGLSEAEEVEWWAMQPEGARYGDGADPEQLARFSAGEALVLDMTQPPLDQVPNPFGITTALYLPMRLAGRMVGILSLDHAGERHEYNAQEIALAQGVADLAVLVIEREWLLAAHTAAQVREMSLQAINTQMLSFLGIAGHELRTPVTSMKANVQLASRAISLSMQADLPEIIMTKLVRAQHLLTNADRQVGKLNLLIQDLLDITRIHAGKLELRRAPTDLIAIVSDAVADQLPLWPNRELKLLLPETPIILDLDADRIGQVVTNYLTNALKYSAPTTSVQIEVVQDSDEVRVAVTDHGPGIAEEAQTQIWELFQQAPGIVQQSGAGVGLGLGLYICQTIIARHEGHVGVNSTVGQGSTFWFTLPMVGP